MPGQVILIGSDQPLHPFRSQVELGIAYIHVNYRQVVAVEVCIADRSGQRVDDLPGSGGISGQLSPIGRFDIGGNAGGQFRPVLSGPHQVAAEIIHPFEVLGIGDIICLDQELD